MKQKMMWAAMAAAMTCSAQVTVKSPAGKVVAEDPQERRFRGSFCEREVDGRTKG